MVTDAVERLSYRVSAFKFRDPEGHPLELLAFPADNVPAIWQRRQRNGDSLGIDHSAISVADTTKSVEFYRRITGFEVSATSLNTGVELEQLDGLKNAAGEVTVLSPPGRAPPHLELL